MKKKSLLIITLFFTFLLVGAGCSVSSNSQKVLNVSEDRGYTSFNKEEIQQIIKDKQEEGSVITKEEKQDIWFILEEEKMVRDLYYNFYQEYDNEVFEKLYKAENTQFEAVQQLVRNYNLEDPTSNKDVGKFKNLQIQMIYDELLEQGNENIKESMIASIDAQERSLRDVRENIERTDKDDIIFVFKNLETASKNHLRILMERLKEEGKDYESQYLEQADFDDITSDEIETGAWWKFWR